ncbi:MAG TPA: HEPN domain-containing protein [Patescibacteria group bacterium]|nr:HEPN domain-containing protein [Patescibacteria group bacterium]
MDQKGLVNYWKLTAEHDYETMLALYKIKRYSDCLFFGHIVLEKALKALVVSQTGSQAPFTHDLVRLEKLSGAGLSEKDIDLLDQINEFNIRTRYPEYKLDFYKKCTPVYTKKYFEKIQKLYQILWQKIKQ